MLISFCIFTYNQEKFVADALLGAFSQTYPFLEIIIIDDGSTDETQNIIRKKISEYKGPHRIKTQLKKRNFGLANSVNAAIYDLAEGDWLIFSAGDDISSPERSIEVAQIAKNYPSVTSIQGSALIVNEDLDLIGYRIPARNTIFDLHRLTVCGASASYKRDAVCRFPPIGEIVPNEDFILTGRALLSGNQAESLTESVLWRRHGKNLTDRLSETGKDFHSVSLSLLQQISDLCYLAVEGRLDRSLALSLTARLLSRINRLDRKAKYMQARTSEVDLLKYLLSSPFRGSREIIISILIYLLKKIRNYFKV